jgi:F-type H+-transporting ATPase subunit delta
MAELSAVYASALFDMFLDRVQKESDSDAPGAFEKNYLEQAVFMRDMLSDPDCHKILVHPHISGKEKREFFGNAFAGQINSDFTGVLFLSIQKNREAYLVRAFTELINKVERYQRIARAKVITANLLNDGQIASLTAMLSKKLDKTVEITQEVDPSVIGGIYIYVDGFFIDKTIRTQLREMKSSIIEGGGS